MNRLCVPARPLLTEPAHLRGRSAYGDAVEDEWFIVFLLRELTRQLPVSARVWDSDGEFLLIEAAYHLPKWCASASLARQSCPAHPQPVDDPERSPTVCRRCADVTGFIAGQAGRTAQSTECFSTAERCTLCLPLSSAHRASARRSQPSPIAVRFSRRLLRTPPESGRDQSMCLLLTPFATVLLSSVRRSSGHARSRGSSGRRRGRTPRVSRAREAQHAHSALPRACEGCCAAPGRAPAGGAPICAAPNARFVTDCSFAPRLRSAILWSRCPAKGSE